MLKSIVRNQISKSIQRLEENVRQQSLMTYEERNTILFHSLELEWHLVTLKVIILFALIGIRLEESVKCDGGEPGA